MSCPNGECLADVPAHERYCVVCGTDAGFPNVRAALEINEVKALTWRVEKAHTYAKSVGAQGVLSDFRDAVRSAKAVISLPLSRVHALVSSDNSLFGTFYKCVDADARLPETNEWDTVRQSVDALVFPYYFKEIRFGALSLDGLGVAKYGGLSMTLRDTMIRKRTSVFEENTIEFVNKRVPRGDPIPVGYRATWDSRDQLAAAKVAPQMASFTKKEEFPNLLINGDDFMEVHIFGPIHRRAIEKLTGKYPNNKSDRVLLKSVERKLKEVGAEYERI